MTWREGWYIMKDGRTHVGPFKTEQEATEVYHKNRRQLGECSVERWPNEERQET